MIGRCPGLGEQARDVQRRAERLQDEETPAAEGKEAFYIGPFSLLINGRGSWFDFDRDETDAERAFDGHTASAQVGLDYRLSDRAVIGGFFVYERTDSEFNADQPGRNFTPAANEGETDADSYGFTLFGTYNLTDTLFLEGDLGYSYTDYTFTRNVVFQEINRLVPQTNVRTEGDTNGDEFWVSGGMGYDIYHGALRYGPYARVTYARSEIDDYTEDDLTSSGLGMTIDENTRESVTTVVGVRGSYPISTNWGVLVPQARVEYEHEFDKDAQTTTTVFVLDAAGNRFTLSGEDPDRNHVNLGASLIAVLPNGWSPFLDFEALVGYEDLDQYRVAGGLRVEF